MAPKFNWALSGGSFSRLTFQVRRRTCLEAKRVRGGSKIEELTAKYFADVPTHVKEKLKRLYRLDLAMFGYEANI